MACRKTQRERVYAAIHHAGLRGMTDQECQRALRMSGDTQRPRRIELRKAGVIKPIGHRRDRMTRKYCTIWRACASA